MNSIIMNIHKRTDHCRPGNEARVIDAFAVLTTAGFLLVPVTVDAYIGPGAGLSLLGALWAFLLAVGTAVIFLFAWPIRRIIRRRREAQPPAGADQGIPETDAPHAAADREDPVDQARRQ